MPSDRPRLGIALALAMIAGCTQRAGPSELAVALTGIEPGCGDPAGDTRVVVRGTLPVKPSTSLASSETTIDTAYRAWIGDHELATVTWIDAGRMEAVVPAGLPVGMYALTVTSPFGTSASLPDAFRVEQRACAAERPALVMAAASLAPNTVTVGQKFLVTATVRNDGLSTAHVVTGEITLPPTGFEIVDAAAGPQDLVSGGSLDLTWTVRATDVTPFPGVTFAAYATGTDGAGMPIAAPPRATGYLLVNAPASVTARAQATSPVDIGQAITYSVIVSNTGSAPALVVATLEGTASEAAALTAGPAPAPQIVSGAGQVTFTRTFTANTGCVVTLDVTLAATDANSGLPVMVAPVAPVSVDVQRPAALTTVATASPATVVPGATVTVTATVQNTGDATATGVIATVSSAPAGFTAVSSNAAGRDVPGGGTSVFTFSYQASAGAGVGSFAIDAAGHDANTAQTVSAQRVSTGPVAVAYTVGGTVTGLTGTVVLADGGGDALTIPADGSFTFATPLATGATYHVTVQTQPAGQWCTIANGDGTVPTANVTDVVVTCAASTYSIGGTVSGLSGTEKLVLTDDGGDALTIHGDGAFVFDTPLPDGATYHVAVKTQPSGQVCAVANGDGVVAGANVTTVVVTCATSM
jgi:uncharacterized repeat protein (TIGR01451 family)